MNTEKLNEIIEYLKANPGTHWQKAWTSLSAHTIREKRLDEVTINCGTAACLAGHGAFRYAPAGTKFFQNRFLLPGDSEWSFYPDYGREVYELQYWEALWLFDENRTIEEMDRFVNDPDFYNVIKGTEYMSDEEIKENGAWYTDFM